MDEPLDNGATGSDRLHEWLERELAVAGSELIRMSALIMATDYSDPRAEKFRRSVLDRAALAVRQADAALVRFEGRIRNSANEAHA